MTNHTNLIERLRKPLGNFRIDGRLVTIQECIEAAQAISTLAAEVEGLRAALGAIGSQAICYGMAASEAELRDWLRFISETAEATLTKGEGDKP